MHTIAFLRRYRAQYLKPYLTDDERAIPRDLFGRNICGTILNVVRPLIMAVIFTAVVTSHVISFTKRYP